MAGALLCMPRLYGQAHLIDTDVPGLLLWVAVALAFWNGLTEPRARRWRVAVGVLLGLGFVEKLNVVVVLVPVLLWLAAARLPCAFNRLARRYTWIDGLVTTGAMLAPLGMAFQQIQVLQQRFPPPNSTDLFLDPPQADRPGAIWASPLGIWLVRRAARAALFPKSPLWGAERPGLETLDRDPGLWAGRWLAGQPGLVAGNAAAAGPLLHSEQPAQGRAPGHPDHLFRSGSSNTSSLPWHNAWVLMGITVPAAILGAAFIGLLWMLRRIRADKLPLYFLLHLLTLPVIRMFDTPAHDGVRLFLPAFFFLAAFAGWGAIWLADAIARKTRASIGFVRLVVSGLVVGSAAGALLDIHPYELSYYNELIGGPRGAWTRGFES